MTNPHDPKATPACDESLNERAASDRRAYERPQLTVLGSVRELTLAAVGSNNDGNLGQQRS
ncbi:MAG: lasso RiPP family leader peptide-containing protein [Deltaproteobacteria bacterium]|nr:lasso RiPP family leader peptide-containing protein [Deltaproteobacteria bacterium]